MRWSEFATTVIGANCEYAPFPDVPFRAVALPRRAPFGLNAAYGARVVEAVRELRPALVEVHNQPELAFHIARRSAGARVALVLHNDPQGMRSTRAAAGRAVLAESLAGIATVSEFMRRRFLDGLSEGAGGKIAVLPNCVDLGALPPALPLENREKLILFAGRMVADKGADTFVAACARALPGLRGWRAEMIGADRFGPTSPETRFLRGLRGAAERAGVAMPGYRPHAGVMEAMARAAIVAVPSRWAEPFGLSALEALASGAALICTRQGALPEVAGDAARYVEPDDPVGLGDAIVELATDAARRAALARAGVERTRGFDLSPAAAALDAWRTAILR